jgi:uncharacterized damage-inducible protein DinB
MTENDALRQQLVRMLDWQDAHATFDSAVEGMPWNMQGVRPQGLPYSAWELLEHLRFTQWDILEFCRNPGYQEPDWPADYWPASPTPPDADSWAESVEAFRANRESLKELAADPSIDLFAQIPHGSSQTYLRELLLVADHNSYHVGQVVAVRKLLGVWK